MKNSTKLIIGIVVLALIAISARVASANGIYFLPTAQTATATSTVTTLTPAISTTLSYDLYTASTSLNTTGGMGAVLLLQSTGSTTASIVNVAFQYSHDNIDWYDDESRYGTSSVVVNGTVPQSYAITQAVTRTNKAIPFNTYTRYVRAVISSGAATSTVWAQIVPVKEVKE